ncbi:maltokinase N-terminal cap-like domain-containing protein [Streptomyces atratus]|uniref:maltokinase N-terminal cap-like domain-containing protein n=1 Tax=Streptomyces atratus TaxID=1893 RepID=UPI003F53FC8D
MIVKRLGRPGSRQSLRKSSARTHEGPAHGDSVGRAASRTRPPSLDHPKGEVGIEFMAVTDTSGDQPVTYQVPFSCRGAPIAGSDAALIGTTWTSTPRRWC